MEPDKYGPMVQLNTVESKEHGTRTAKSMLDIADLEKASRDQIQQFLMSLR